MTQDEFYAAQDAVNMLLSAFYDVEQTVTKLADAELEFPDEDYEYLKWISADYPASGEPGARYVVLTNDGAIYFQTPNTDGKFMKNVKWWLRLPQIPKES